MGELLALKWEDIDFSTAQLHVRRTINRLAKYEAHDGENKTEIVFGTPKTKNSRRTIPLTRTMTDELTRWKQFGQGISTPTMASSSPTSLDTTLSRKLSRITMTAC